MSTTRLRLFVAMLVLGTLIGNLAPTVAVAAVPSPADSDTPECLVACPEGDILYRVVVRDLAHNTIAGSTVVLDFSACATLPYCGPTTGPYAIDHGSRQIIRTTDGLGIADFTLAMRGTCGDIQVRIFADGVLLDTAQLATLDQNGNGAVDSADAGLVTGKIGGSDLSADFDCSGSVGTSDVNFLLGHDGHECPLPTPGARSSWGTLKIHYR